MVAEELKDELKKLKPRIEKLRGYL